MIVINEEVYKRDKTIFIRIRDLSQKGRDELGIYKSHNPALYATPILDNMSH